MVWKSLLGAIEEVSTGNKEVIGEFHECLDVLIVLKDGRVKVEYDFHSLFAQGLC